MNNTPKGIVISEDKGLYQKLSANLAPIVEITGRTPDIASGYKLAREANVDLVFLDLTDKAPDCINFAKRIKRVQPETEVFMVGSTRDPDLLLDGMRAGASDFLTYPFEEKAVIASVKDALDRGGNLSKGGEIVSVFSLKGGVGVTTIAINLASHVFDLTRDKVLLFDLNLFMGDISSYLNIETAYTPYDLLRDVERMDENLMFSSVDQHDAGFYVMTTPGEISDSDQVSPADILSMLGVLKKHFDYIIVDCPHDFSERTLKVCSFSDTVFVVTQQTIPTVKSVQKVIEFFRDMEFDPDKVQVIINRYLKDSTMEASDLEGVFQKKIFSKISNDYPLFAKISTKGETVNHGAEKHRINREYQAMAGDLTGISPASDGFWKQLFSGGLFR
ncbi:MAG: AAA family ATPase [Desulfobacterium sp.]|nr:AAA family ATPase [Desulfobacterium sp.]